MAKTKTSSVKYRVLIGFDYCDSSGEWSRKEIGDFIEDVPLNDEQWLIDQGAITTDLDPAPEPELVVPTEADVALVDAATNATAEDVIDIPVDDTNEEEVA